MFPSVDYVKSLISKESLKSLTPVVIDCTYIYGADYTAAKTIESMLREFNSRLQPLLFFNLKSSVSDMLEGANISFHVFYDLATLEDAIDSQSEKRTSL